VSTCCRSTDRLRPITGLSRAQRARARATSEAGTTASATHFVLHVLWPRDGALHLILEGDEDPADLSDLLAERLGDSDWEPQWRYVPEAEDSPAELLAGLRSEWVINMAVEPETRRCEGCQWSGVPPHRDGCEFELRDDDLQVKQEVDADQRGPTLYRDEEETERAEAEEAAPTLAEV
jgi:hypothetical protein